MKVERTWWKSNKKYVICIPLLIRYLEVSKEKETELLPPDIDCGDSGL